MPTAPILAQKVRWRPPDGLAGITFWSKDDRTDRQDMAWDLLRPELETKLLPQLFADPHGYSFAVLEYNGKRDWLVQILNSKGERYCSVWFGGNPDKGWAKDDLIHVGDENDTPRVWQTYERYSDNSYRRVFSRCASLDEMKR